MFCLIVLLIPLWMPSVSAGKTGLLNTPMFLQPRRNTGRPPGILDAIPAGFASTLPAIPMNAVAQGELSAVKAHIGRFCLREKQKAPVRRQSAPGRSISRYHPDSADTSALITADNGAAPSESTKAARPKIYAKSVHGGVSLFPNAHGDLHKTATRRLAPPVFSLPGAVLLLLRGVPDRNGIIVTQSQMVVKRGGQKKQKARGMLVCVFFYLSIV